MLKKMNLMMSNLKTREGFTQALVFILMLSAYNIKHVASFIFMLLFFISLYTIAKPIYKIELTKAEKYAFVFITIYFLWFIITSLNAGWEYNDTKRLGSEIRFFLAIPIYILFRQVKGVLLPLWYGVTFSLWLSFFIVIYQVYILNIPAAGGYGKLLLGPMSVLYIFIFLSRKNWIINKKLMVFSVATVVVGCVAVVLSGARTAYIMLLLLALIWIAMNYNWRKQVLLVICVFVIARVLYFDSSTVQQGVDEAFNVVKNYSFASKKNINKGLGSTETRLEMMKASYLITVDNPIFGIGAGNLKKTSEKYIEKGSYHPMLQEFSHLHNIYADNAAKKGVPGLVLTILMFFVPLWYFFKRKKEYYFPAALGFYYVAGEIIAGFTIVAPIERANFIAISMIVLGVCFSELTRFALSRKSIG